MSDGKELIVGKFFDPKPFDASELQSKTPRKFVEQDPKGFDYVRVGYMRRKWISQVGHNWSLSATLAISDEIMLRMKQVVVKVTMTIPNPSGGAPIVREAFGSSAIKCFRSDHPKNPNMPMDLGNDFKAAEADGMKKIMSYFGVAQDVYEPQVEAILKQMRAEAERKAKQPAADETPVEPTLEPTSPINKKVMRAIFQAAENAQINKTDLYKYVKIKFKKQFKDLSIEECDKLQEWMAGKLKK